MHSDDTVTEDIKKSPGMILRYNNYKSGYDIMDQMSTRYSTKHCILVARLAYLKISVQDIISIYSLKI